ncbi:hypothetical protein [Viridibacillus arvi]|uniref:hypothetical protein n=1 Tax=Viridibacillus arvi TaxID=263475 RepID=UPI0034CD8E4C
MVDNNIYDIQFHESTHTYANPYWLWIQIHIPDERFYFYLKDTCINKRVVIYEFVDPFLSKFNLTSATNIYIDRLENLLNNNPNIYPNQIMDIDLTEELNLTFSKEKQRERFKKQFAKRVQQFIVYEHKIYRKILEKMKEEGNFQYEDNNTVIIDTNPKKKFFR